MNDSDDRRQAASILIRVEAGAFSNRLLGEGTRRGVRVRVLGTIRQQRLLDAVLEKHSRRPLDKFDPEVRIILRLGLFESRFLGIPRAVATDAAVRLVRGFGKKSASGLVNALLRRANENWDHIASQAPPDVQFSHPRWLYERWLNAFGREATHAAMQSNQEAAPLCVWFASEQIRDNALQHFDLEPHPWCPAAWTTVDGASGLIGMVRNGHAYAQDASSQLVAHIASTFVDDDSTVFDLCAAPGGKTALLLRLSRPRCLVAADIRLARARLVARRVDNMMVSHPNCLVLAADAASPPLQPGSADLVLLDAPCSGSGTLCRHPEIRWRLEASDLQDLAQLQKRLIAATIPVIRPGGILLYATCSVEAEENERHFESTSGQTENVDLGERIPTEVNALSTPSKGVRVLPDRLGDGFTIHALRITD